MLWPPHTRTWESIHTQAPAFCRVSSTDHEVCRARRTGAPQADGLGSSRGRWQPECRRGRTPPRPTRAECPPDLRLTKKACGQVPMAPLGRLVVAGVRLRARESLHLGWYRPGTAHGVPQHRGERRACGCSAREAVRDAAARMKGDEVCQETTDLRPSLYGRLPSIDTTVVQGNTSFRSPQSSTHVTYESALPTKRSSPSQVSWKSRW